MKQSKNGVDHPEDDPNSSADWDENYPAQEASAKNSTEDKPDTDNLDVGKNNHEDYGRTSHGDDITSGDTNQSESGTQIDDLNSNQAEAEANHVSEDIEPDHGEEEDDDYDPDMEEL